MVDDDSTPKDYESAIRQPPLVLIPVEVLEGETIPEPLVDFLAPSEVVVLGYHVLPEQTPVEQASMQFEDRAREAVADIAHAFEAAGRTVETRVAFTHDRDKTIERVAGEVGATATLLSNPTGEVSEVLVPLRGAIDVDRLADLVGVLVGGGDEQVTLWALASEEDDAEAQRLLDTAERTLLDRGVPDDRLRAETAVVDAPLRAIVERSAEFDVIVMGEGGPSLLAGLLGDDTERVADGAVAPVITVRSRGAE